MRLATQIILIALFIALIVWDIVAYLKSGNWGTISSVLWSWGKDYPIVPLLVGILIGHFFWQADLTNKK